jgi:hypothetical protein
MHGPWITLQASDWMTGARRDHDDSADDTFWVGECDSVRIGRGGAHVRFPGARSRPVFVTVR